MHHVRQEHLPSIEAPVGLGEPGTTVVTPAIESAIFLATGIRLRHSPVRQSAVLAALGSQRSKTLTRSHGGGQLVQKRR